MMPFRVIIPARYHSTRLPKKMLADVAGKPLLQHVYERACQSAAHEVIIATDHKDILDVAERFAERVILTSDAHVSGTERLAEVVDQLDLDDEDLVVNVQGDEVLMPPQAINQVAENLLRYADAAITTLCYPLHDSESLWNPKAVKVVLDRENFALYFSRAPIPWDRDEFSNPDKTAIHAQHHFIHIGLYGYRVATLRQYVTWPVSPLERLESLEQLRALFQGARIHVDLAHHPVPAGVDTPEDLERVRALISDPNTTIE